VDGGAALTSRQQTPSRTEPHPRPIPERAGRRAGMGGAKSHAENYSFLPGIQIVGRNALERQTLAPPNRIRERKGAAHGVPLSAVRLFVHECDTVSGNSSR
jgi:hypothetical protein